VPTGGFVSGGGWKTWGGCDFVGALKGVEEFFKSSFSQCENRVAKALENQ